MHYEAMTQDGAALLASIKNFKKDNMLKETNVKLQPYLENLKFMPASISRVCRASGIICGWIRALSKYQIVHESAQPKRIMLEMAGEAHKRATVPHKTAKKALVRLNQTNSKVADDLKTAGQKEAVIEAMANDAARKLQLLENAVDKHRDQQPGVKFLSFTQEYRVALSDFWRLLTKKGTIRLSAPNPFTRKYCDESCGESESVVTRNGKINRIAVCNALLERVRADVETTQTKSLERMVYLKVRRSGQLFLSLAVSHA